MEKGTGIDLCSFGELWDEDGDAIFESNLANAFEFLKKGKLLDDKKQKYIFWVSKISYKGGINRYIVEREGTILKLLNCWRITFKNQFSVESLKEFHEKENFKMEVLERRGQGKVAWGLYSSCVRMENERREYKNAYKLPPGQKEKEIQRLKNRPNLVVIGG